jgi:CheY-like chemotaxis protein
MVLLIEDDAAHATLVMRCFEDHGIENIVHHISDGEKALEYLFDRGACLDEGKRPRPDLILLDLRLPKIDGIDILKQIKNSEELKHTPVVILSTSNAHRDMAAAYGEHANSYVVKPVDFADFTQMIRDMGSYWLSWNCRPRESRR